MKKLFSIKNNQVNIKEAVQVRTASFFIFFSIAFIFFIGILIRTKLLILNPSYWFDTCALGINMEKSYIELFKPLDCSQVAPVFFLYVSKFFYGIFYNGTDIFQKDFSLRLFPYICGILSLFIFPYMVQKIFKNWYLTIFSLFLLSLNPIAIYYSIEFKQYELELLVSVILLYVFYDFSLKSSSKKKYLIYSFIIAISVWFSNGVLFIIPAGGLILLYEAIKERKLKKYIIFFIPFILSFFIFFKYFFLPVKNEMMEVMTEFWGVLDPAFFTFSNFSEKFSQRINELIELPDKINIFVFMMINIIIMAVYKKFKELALVIMPLCFVILASFLNIYPFATRLILFLLPLLIILYSQIFLTVKENKYLVAIFSIIIIFFAYKNMEKPIEDYIINNYQSRELFLDIKNKNPELKNIISTEGSVIIKYYGGIESIFLEESFIGFSKSRIPDYFKNKKHTGEYWIYSPFNSLDYCEKLIEYLKKNPKIEIKEFYEETNNTFSAKIKVKS